MKPKYKLTLVLSSKNKEYFWRIVHKNGKEICRSSETYKRKIDCLTSLGRLLEAIAMKDYAADEDA
jgi:uncharacterized protein YegP (UPF0339 family)